MIRLWPPKEKNNSPLKFWKNVVKQKSANSDIVIAQKYAQTGFTFGKYK